MKTYINKLLRPFVIGFAISLSPQALAIKTIDDFEKLSDRDKSTKAGQEYESKAISAMGPKLAEAMRICSPPGSGTKGFDLYYEISSTGNTISIVHTEKSLAASCVKKMLGQFQFPAPPFSPFHLRIEMKITK